MWVRAPQHDKRFSRGDNFAGDAWRDESTGRIKIVAVGRKPIEQELDGGDWMDHIYNRGW